ncbi:CHRD domain-containing protein [Methylobacterium oryzae]|uniref:CHRD domain-containing protein n=1 Tax=Methylobacterium oryzae TaxID=334852 RepID=UPI002F3537C2
MTARKSHRWTTSLAALLVLGVPLATGPAFAAGKDVTYRAALTGGSEVPATASSGKGEITATFDPATKRLSWSGQYSGLTGPVTANLMAQCHQFAGPVMRTAAGLESH